MAAYEPRLTSIDNVRRSMRVPEQGQFLPGGEESLRILAVIEAAETDIFELCNERFDVAGADASARSFRCPRDGMLLTDRFAADPELVERLASRSAADGSAIGAAAWDVVSPPKPLRAGRHLQSYRFYAGSWYRITARWGWLSIPASVKEAATMAARRLYSRETSPLGIVDGDAGIYIPREDRDVIRLLRSYIPAAAA
ncbi:MAG: hypothetical protein F4X64_03020 [Chloroflexi bacterium]|nr:hypothetical protein [Chloroflexota bacterium]